MATRRRSVGAFRKSSASRTSSKRRHHGVEIWNLAVPGYGLDQEILAYELDGQRFEADEVVLLVSTETLSRLPYDYIYRKHKPKFVLDAEGRLELVPIRRGVSAGIGRPLRHAQRLLPALLSRVAT